MNCIYLEAAFLHQDSLDMVDMMGKVEVSMLVLAVLGKLD